MSENQTEMVAVTIDGQEVNVPRGTTILKAARELGTDVPHYCYHDGLSAPAMCRLCLVEVEGAPKLLPGCVTQVADGQVVHTQSEKAERMRKGVLEFYLVNHPLDCPICDMSGECNLQDYVHEGGRDHGRGREPKRIFGRDDFGGDVLYYGDRCVMCTRCVRFMTEMEQNALLTVVERGNRSVIDTFFERGLGEAKWAGNVVDICPVGALVSKDFLYKARAWDLDHVPSICPNCSQGCNIDLHTRDNQVQRVKPRTNLDVNQYWMCDYGRSNYEWINRGDRLEAPVVRQEGRATAMGWSDALSALADRLEGVSGGVKAVVSPHWSNEDVGAVMALVESLGGGDAVFRSRRAADEDVMPGFPSLARRRDLAPNGTGLEALGATRVGSDDGTGGLDDVKSHTGVVLVLGDGLEEESSAIAEDAALTVYFGAYESAAMAAADFSLPVTTFAEQEGTFTNHEGRVQHFSQALHVPGAARPAWLVAGMLAAVMSGGTGVTTAADAFARLGDRSDTFKGICYDDLGTRGALVNETVPMTGD
jgi:NADH-quinone oxidoreductase subunit G